MNFTKTTEQSSKYEHLEKMSVAECYQYQSGRRQTVPFAVEKHCPKLKI
jgi:N-acetylmuramic acid 6-phosphate etherase